MKKVRWILLAVAVTVVLALGITYAFATGSPTPAPPSWSQMHNAPGMQQMHDQMPAAAQGQCAQMHGQMGTMMNGQMGSGMMGS